MKAYAILDGGGVLGAALVGCLKACEQMGLDLVGYAGTSAGSIVAVLASVGYTADEMSEIMCGEIDFVDFLDDRGTLLASCSDLVGSPGLWGIVTRWWTLRRIHRHFGLYQGTEIKHFLTRKIRGKIRHLEHNTIDFEALDRAGCKPLKIIASDVGLQRPVVFSSQRFDGQNEQVVDAVRASISYPLVFQPVRVHDRFLVDGGLCSNLPVFAFEKERRESNLPILAFDLVQAPRAPEQGYGFLQFCRDMISTSLESHDVLIRDRIHGVHHIPIPVPDGFDALRFDLPRSDRETLFHRGYNAAMEYFASKLFHWKQTSNEVERLQALMPAEPDRVKELLEAIARDVASISRARGLRCAVMLPTGRNTRIVVYHHNMDRDPDIDLEIPTMSGCTGASWKERGPAFANLDDARSDPERWGLTRAQQNKVPMKQKSMASAPIFSYRRRPVVRSDIVDLELLGTLSLDSSTPLENTGWVTEEGADAVIVDKLRFWADVVSKFLT
jgi:NTE family protein